MKKVYSKPEIMFEDFSLSTNIASCDVSTNFAKNQCGFLVGGIGNIFVTKDICDVPMTDGAWDGICYHVPTDDKELFAS